MTTISDRIAASIAVTGEEDNPFAWGETRRICELPISEPPSDEDVTDISRRTLLTTAFERGERLRMSQAWAMRDVENEGAAFLKIGVGEGKTLTAVLIAKHFYQRGDCLRPLILLPSATYEEFFDSHLPWQRGMISFPFQVYGMGDKDAKARVAVAALRRKGLYVMPYSYLSVGNTDEMLDALKPDLFIADEAHKLANAGAARTKRFFHYLATLANPRFFPLSGTFTTSQLRQYHHLLRMSLGSKAPIPQSVQLSTEWGSIIDSGVTAVSDNAQVGPLRPLLAWARENFPGRSSELQVNVPGFREAYKLRFLTAPGVISTGKETLNVGLILNKWDVPKPLSLKLPKLVQDLNDLWVTPNGDEIDHAIHLYKWGYELSYGFYNSLTWPTTEQVVQKRGYAADVADRVLLEAKEHHEAKQVYNKLLRNWFKDHHVKGADTPFLVGGHMARGDAGMLPSAGALHEAWQDMKTREHPGMIERDETQVLVDDFKLIACLKWASERRGKGGLIWVYHRAMARWIKGYLDEADLDTLDAPAGTEDIRDPEKCKGKFVIASLEAHAEGKNLQHLEDTYFLQWPRAAKKAHQTIARNHRQGQTKAKIEYWLPLHDAGDNHVSFDSMLFASTLNDAAYIEQTTGDEQRLLHATYTWRPKIFGYDVLDRLGFKPEGRLSEKTEKIIEGIAKIEVQ